jgi:two-component SAPR family response regulator
LERLLGSLDANLSREPRDPQSIAPLITKAFALYRGAFLKEDTQPWALSSRERLRVKFLRVIGHAADALYANQHDREALTCYQKALEIDPLAEHLHQGVIACHERLGETAAALDAYRHCRETLKRELDVAPSEKTEALYRALRAQDLRRSG